MKFNITNFINIVSKHINQTFMTCLRIMISWIRSQKIDLGMTLDKCGSRLSTVYKLLLDTHDSLLNYNQKQYQIFSFKTGYAPHRAFAAVNSHAHPKIHDHTRTSRQNKFSPSKLQAPGHYNKTRISHYPKPASVRARAAWFNPHVDESAHNRRGRAPEYNRTRRQFVSFHNRARLAPRIDCPTKSGSIMTLECGGGGRRKLSQARVNGENSRGYM